jgi:hypothetical protein
MPSAVWAWNFFLDGSSKNVIVYRIRPQENSTFGEGG